jgi:menaquinone-dependent protoporphyrinogen oxidase
MENKVLVAYATKHGATAEIAAKIGETLRQNGLSVDVLPAGKCGDLSAYSAVVLGSAVYVGQWQKDAIAFLESKEKELAARPVWLFSSGPTGEGDQAEIMQGWTFPEKQKPIAERIQPRDITIFFGAIDSNKLGFTEKLLIKGVKAPTGDFRDWEAISAWAVSIAVVLNQPT